ncbi:MAG TPA: hypothetical protein VGZ47_03620 [Gemmataceae bacterium]|nr:hypothetical protein [Gemmataceae bacterium]
MKEFEIYLPLTYNDGAPIEDDKIEQVGVRLLEFFDGMTYFPQENRGFWKMGNVVYRDKIVIFRVLSKKDRAARKFLKNLKKELMRSLRQEDILIVEKDAAAL